jgi:hypothetical protein
MKKIIYLIAILVILITVGCHRYVREEINGQVYYRHKRTGLLFHESYFQLQREIRERNMMILLDIIVNSNRDNQSGYTPAPSGGLLPPYTKDVYGPGTWSDGTGRPFHWQTNDGQTVPFGDVKPDVYGPGPGMDQFGRPVRPKPLH